MDKERKAIERLRELATADKEGRCVVLPCKLGNWENPLVTHWMPLPELRKTNKGFRAIVKLED